MDIDYGQYYPVWVDEFKRCAPWIEGALEYANGDFDLQDIATGISMRQYQLWTCATAVVVTQYLHSNKKVTLHLFLAGGDLDGVEELVRECEVWGRQAGVNAMSLTGREGWKKSFLKPLGFHDVSINMYKELD
jgi:hypothetical protein